MAQGVRLPVIVPGAGGTVPVVMASVCAGLFPQALVATTEIVPPAVPVVTLIEFVDEEPLHPEGSVQI